MSVPVPKDFVIQSLGPPRVRSPYRASRFVSDEERTLYQTNIRLDDGSDQRCGSATPLSFELAGPRKHLYFDPTKTRCGIVTCGGLCPGLNAVIRAIVLQLYHQYHVRTIYGFQYGFEGLIPEYNHPAIMLDLNSVSNIHQRGGTILASSRGPQSPSDMVDALERLNIQVLFCIGGDGTFRGALDLTQEIKSRHLKISVIAIPKTIDNDVSFTTRTFGFETAYSAAAAAIRGAHVEATGAFHGIGLLKLMGRHAGFIAAHAALASGDANFVLVPEVNFELGGDNGFLPHLYRRLKARRHAVIVVAEGAGQHLFDSNATGTMANDASGNVRFKDIGILLRDRISEYLKLMGVPSTLKYIDPSYLIRSAPATPSDSLFAGILGQMAVHAGMAGKTAVFIGYWNDRFTHVPLEAAVSVPKRIDPSRNFWQSVVECTGQPQCMVNSGEGFSENQDEAIMESCV